MEEVLNEQASISHNIPKSERHYGLDLLRIVSMLMVLVCHLSNYSFLCGIIPAGSNDEIIRQILVAFSIVMINCYILTTSYFLVKQRFRLSRLFKLEMIVIFWLAVCCIINAVRGVPDFWENEFLIPFFPVLLRVFWFYSAYIGLCLVSPLLNLAIRHMSKGMHLVVCILLVMMATVLNNVMSYTNAFTFSDGYNLAWFVVLYFVGGYIRLYVNPNKINVWWALALYIVMCALIVGDWFFIRFLGSVNPWFEARFSPSSPYNYNSVFTFLASLGFFLIFLKLPIKNKILQKTIGFIAPHVFAVYILDRGYIANLQYEYAYKLFNFPQFPFLQIFAVVILLFVFRILLDYLRSLVFLLFEKRSWYKSFLVKLDNLPYLIVDKINSKSQKGE